ncbi:hypothetical protein BSLG_001245 [Batrachochytrium salamandrivorans]|nr:hypothetical protein BASA83_007457 [Batrachochytrium salamandrivorans]KAJ1344105.1 hypothetical protein BSLG_001245 [Batrachochytrium salamandrivorans]
MEQLNHFAKMIPKLGITRLKDLIKSIRACKTAADERAVIAKESANIRTAFKEENNDTRYINVGKLLYIHMLGYPAHFGQIECLKLVASPRFSDKRLAYLGIMLLLDENQETLTLVTNCLKNDMNNPNMFTVGLALCTLGNIASQEMSRDLSNEVERLLGSTNSYLRKKAALCALRIIRKVPDLIENFLERTQALLSERSHGVLLTGVALLTEMCIISPEITPVVRENVPVLVLHLKSLVTTGVSPEHDVGGISDPFLQVKILRLLRVLGAGDAHSSEIMNDVLAQVATTTESSKNVGNAILYETVLTIMNIESDVSLRVLGINILGRFLSNRDNNIKYVALTTLTKTSHASGSTDSSALQRHRSTVLECLRDGDISIRRRALDLSFFLINPTNIRILMRELLSFLEIAESDIKSSVASRICDYAGRHRPNKRWEIDTVTRVLRVAGAFVDQNVVNHFVKLVSTGDTAVHQYAVRKLYNIIKTEGEVAYIQEGLLQASFWSIGEYGDVLVSSSISALGFGIEEDAEGISDAKKSDSLATPTEIEVVDLIVVILRGPYATAFVKEYAITCLVKLCTRFSDKSVIDYIKNMISKYRVNIDVEIQQRAVEYEQIFTLDNETRAALMEHMPVLESAMAEEALKGTGAAPGVITPTSTTGGQSLAGNLLGDDLTGLSMGGASGTVGASTNIYDMMFGSNADGHTAVKGENIMDLLGGIGLDSGYGKPAADIHPAKTGQLSTHTTQENLLGDLFGGMGGMGGMSGMGGASNTMANPLADLLGGGMGSSATSPAQSKAYVCYEKHGLRITLTPTRESATSLGIVAQFYNIGSSGLISNIFFQIAVPKSLRLAMQPSTSTQVEPGQTISQNVHLENPTKVAIRLRLKISFAAGGQAVDEIVEFSSFESTLWT